MYFCVVTPQSLFPKQHETPMRFIFHQYGKTEQNIMTTILYDDSQENTMDLQKSPV